MEQLPSYLLEQANIRNSIVPPLCHFLRQTLAKAFGREPFVIRLYGSLHHGLYIPGVSKLCIDITHQFEKPSAQYDCTVLHILVAMLQRDAALCPDCTHPVLLWHRTAQRPLMALLFWRGVLVHVTHRNTAGVAASDFMWRTLANNPLLSLTLLHWKTHLRQKGDLLGPNNGQVSMYALMTILLSYVAELSVLQTLTGYEKYARQLVVAYLGMVPRVMRTPDPLAMNINLTARSFLAADMAQCLGTIPSL